MDRLTCGVSKAESAQRARALTRLCCVVLLATFLNSAAGRPARSEVGDPSGTWLLDDSAAIEIFQCARFLCGRIAWIKEPAGRDGKSHRDTDNPDPGLRQRQLCGLTVLWGLRRTARGQWKDGWFYNPDDGTTYRTTVRLESPEVLIARIYVSLPMFGETKKLKRVLPVTLPGRCR
jgi:uncharacterized protein (DUF2147 family)